jgi:RNA 3'-terminal phosphate cyclase (ATP)
MADLIAIDGSQGEGGGQILRTALGLSLVTGRPFRLDQIRARRAKPGLLRQHLSAVRAAAEVGSARVTGAELGSRSLVFEPGDVRGGEHRFAVGTAGSATLVLQAVLPALMMAHASSGLVLEGGTHNPFAPPFDFLVQTFFPVLRRLGPVVEARLERHGFYPAGGGRFSVTIEPCAPLGQITLLECADVRVSARALVSRLSEDIAERELKVVRERLGIDRGRCRVEAVRNSPGPGNVVMIEVASDAVTEVVTAFGERGKRAEDVAAEACDEADAYLRAGAPVGQHLADQLLIPMALAGGGAFRTPTPTSHTRTNADVIARFLPVAVRIEHEQADAHRVNVAAKASEGSRADGD